MRVLVVALIILAGCTPSAPRAPTPVAFTALYVVKNGPYPLFAQDGDWLATRAPGVSVKQTEEETIEHGLIVRALNKLSPDDGPWLLKGCIFDVQQTSSDAQDASYTWAYGKVVQCDEPAGTGLPEPQMGMRPRALRIYDGLLGYFPMSLLDRYTGNLPAPRQ
jgi:hypothetical protein